MQFPPALKQIQTESEAFGFSMISEPLTDSLLRTLAASKPGGMFLELGTGTTGASTSWLLDGMERDSQLISIENDRTVASIAKKYLESDKQVKFQVVDAASLLNRVTNQKFDLIFADAWIGKYSYLKHTLDLLKPGGLYVTST